MSTVKKSQKVNMYEEMRSAYECGVHDALEKGDPSPALVLCGAVPIPLERVLSVYSEDIVDPAWDHPRPEQLARCGVAIAGWRYVQTRETSIDCALWIDIPTNGNVVDVAECDVGLPFETLDVCRQEVRGGFQYFSVKVCKVIGLQDHL